MNTTYMTKMTIMTLNYNEIKFSTIEKFYIEFRHYNEAKNVPHFYKWWV